MKPITYAALTIIAALGIAFSGAASAQELVMFEIVDDSSIPQSLTGSPGDPVKGRETAINRKTGNCLACHILPIPEQPFHGLLGPDLNGVADRYTEGEIRLHVVDPKLVNEGTIMPAFYKNTGLHRVLKKFQGKTILSAEQVEDIVAYMMTLK